MNELISKLIIYNDFKDDTILLDMADIVRKVKDGINNYYSDDKEDIQKQLYHCVRKILELGTSYGFDNNLWHNYLTFLLMNNENPFSLTCEKTGAGNGSVNLYAKNDFKIFMELFHYDFSKVETYLNTNVISNLLNYKAIEKPELMYNVSVSKRVRKLSLALSKAENEDDFFNLVTGFYKDYGVGMFGLNKAFRIVEKNESSEIVPISNMADIRMDDLVGYEIQKKKLIDNTKAFVAGRRANNVLLFGDSGTGKSTSIKAIINEFYDNGLRLIEIYKHQFKYLSSIIAQIKNRNYKFIIYMDDLSFEDFEIEYKYLKAIIEGGVEIKPDNILIYATSNRRHIIKENWSDRNDVENENGMHRSDTMEEKLSLAYRFGERICYVKPSPNDFYNIVFTLAQRNNIQMDREKLRKEANKWELSHGGLSGRCAKQFIDYLLAMSEDYERREER